MKLIKVFSLTFLFNIFFLSFSHSEIIKEIKPYLLNGNSFIFEQNSHIALLIGYKVREAYCYTVHIGRWLPWRPTVKKRNEPILAFLLVDFSRTM